MKRNVMYIIYPDGTCNTRLFRNNAWSVFGATYMRGVIGSSPEITVPEIWRKHEEDVSLSIPSQIREG